MSDDSRPHAPRKQPRQQRSRALVEAILEATERVIAETGFASLSTTQVADKAGVSVGSLYQYFPSKEALVAAVIERRIDQDLRWLDQLTEAELPLQQLVRRGIERNIALFRHETALHREMIAAMQPVARDELVAAMIAEGTRRFAERLRGHALAVDDPERAAWIVVTTQVAILRSAAATRPGLLDDPRLVDDLERLCMRYLVDDPGAPTPAPNQ